MSSIFPSQQLLIGLVLAAAVGLGAWRMGALQVSGAWAAFIMGSLIFGMGGLSSAVLLLTFFISSSLLSRLFAARKTDLAEKFEKSSRRDWAQVLANGGAAAFVVVLQGLYPDQIWPWMLYAGSLASVTADTWATEIGVLNPSPPRLITSGKPVARGASGGITLLGTLAALAGSGLIAVEAFLLRSNLEFLQVVLPIALGGLGGALIDSFFGATIQGIYMDPVRKKLTEKQPILENGELAQPVQGWAWFNNDIVNFVSSILGAFLTFGLWKMWQ